MFDPVSSNSTQQLFISQALQFLWQHENSRDDKVTLNSAVDCFETALKLGPIGSLNLYQLARAYNWQGNFEKGLEYAEMSIELDPFHKHCYTIWSICKKNASKNTTIRQIISEAEQKMFENRNYFSDYLKISELYAFVDDRASHCAYVLKAVFAAIKLGYNEKEVIQKLQIESEVYFHAAELLKTKNTNNLNSALKNFDLAIKFAIKSDSKQMIAYYCQEAMKICLELSNPEKAIEYYVKSQSYPQHGCELMYLLAGKAYLAKSNKEKALELFSKVIALYEKKEICIFPEDTHYITYAYEQRTKLLAESNQPQPEQASSSSMSTLIGNFSAIMVSAPTNTSAVSNLTSSTSSTSNDQQSRGPGMN